MAKRIIRTLALGAGAGALVLGMAGPAMAAEISVTELPKRVVMTTADTIQVRVATPEGFACTADGALGNWVAFIPGKQDAVALSTKTPCLAGVLTLDVTSNSASPKKNAVVKLVGTGTEDAKVVLTMSVKVTGKTAKPGKGNNR